MRLGILSVAPRSYSTQQLRLAAIRRGHDVKVLHTTRFAIELRSGCPGLRFRGEELSPFDAVIPRIGTTLTDYGTSVVRQFEQMDVYTPNTAQGILESRDKLVTLQLLSSHDIGIPETAYVGSRKDIVAAIESVGGAPVIIKSVRGTQGIGVILAESHNLAQAVIEALLSAGQQVIVQKFISECRGTDVRAFVVGERVVASMRRRARGDEFRSNVHRGGETEAVTLDSAQEAVAVAAARVLGLGVVGVDLLESDEGPRVIELNSSPGLEGIENATGIDVAGEVVEFVARECMER